MSDEKSKSIQEKLLDQKKELLTRYSEEMQKPQDQMAKNAFRMKAIIHLIAIGFTKKQVADQLGTTLSRVNIFLNSEGAKREIERIQEQLFLVNPQKMFMGEVAPAFRKVKRLLHGKKTKDIVVLQAANTIFDRALGKPTQEIKHEGSGIRQLIEMIDKQTYKKQDAIDAEFKEAEEEVKPKSEDPVDQWLDENL